MLRAFRTRGWSIVTAWLLFASLGTTSFGALIHAQSNHDAFPASLEHDASAHRFQGDAPEAPPHPLHCLVCHWARTFRPRPEIAFQPAPAAERRLRLPVILFVATPVALAALP